MTQKIGHHLWMFSSPILDRGGRLGPPQIFRPSYGPDAT
jgi:hypothetical protein